MPLIEEVIGNSTNGNSDIQEFCKTQFTKNAKLLSEYDPYKTVDEGFPLRLVCLVCREGYNAPNCAVVPSWLSDRRDITTVTKGWELISGSALQTLDIPGHHFEPFQPQNVSHFPCFQEFTRLMHTHP